MERTRFEPTRLGPPELGTAEQGLDGPPGEVTSAQLAKEITGTSNNINAVATPDTAPSDPPSFADYEALRAKLNEVNLNGRR